MSKDNEDDPNLIPYVVFEVFHGLLQFCLDLLIVYVWLVVSNMAFIFHFIYGMSSFPFPLTFTPSFFKMVIASPTSHNVCHKLSANIGHEDCD